MLEKYLMEEVKSLFWIKLKVYCVLLQHIDNGKNGDCNGGEMSCMQFIKTSLYVYFGIRYMKTVTFLV